MTIHPRKSSPTGQLPELIGRAIDREYWQAHHDMKKAQGSDWTLHVSTWWREVILEAMRLGIWEAPR